MSGGQHLVRNSLAAATAIEVFVADVHMVEDAPMIQFSEIALETDVLPLKAVEQLYIERVLKVVGGNKTLAAALLKMDRRTLYRRLEKQDEHAA